MPRVVNLNASYELIDEVVVEEEFESRWSDLISEFKLENNDFMDRAYKNRSM
jgi:predicted transcriptional regulator